MKTSIKIIKELTVTYDLKTLIKTIKELTVTYDPDEKVEAIEYCLKNGYEISNTIDKGVIVAKKEMKPFWDKVEAATKR